MSSMTAESRSSGVSWASIIAGAFAAAAMSLILLILGVGLGFYSVSPWTHDNPSATMLTAMTVIWMVIMQWISAGLGGYLAGRLRAKWVDLHSDEVYFRDTAHGFLAWAVATVITASFLASATASAISGSAKAITTVASGAAVGAGQNAAQNTSAINDPSAYFIDTLFRANQPAAPSSDQETRAEATRILLMGIKNGGEVPDADKAYLTQVAAARTGISPQEAALRVDNVIKQIQTAENKAKEAADTARKAAARLSVFSFLSMLVGAFIASVAGALGGWRRDQY